LPAPAARLALPASPGAKAATPTTVTIEGRPIKRLTQAEQEERHCLELYYNCDDKFTRGHNRVCKRLFVLKGFEEEDDGVATETAEDVGNEYMPVFSLQALAGVAFTDMMKLEVRQGSTSLVACWTPAAPITSSRRPLPFGPDCLYSIDCASRLWSLMVNVSRASISSTTLR
jgi:hypothetical protein